MISIIIGALAALFILICGLFRWRQQARNGAVPPPQARDGTGRSSFNVRKPCGPGAPMSYGYSVHYQTAPPAPPLAQTSWSPPRGYDSSRRHSRLQRVSSPTIRFMPEPSIQVSPPFRRAPSSTISRPISSLDPSPPFISPSEHRDEVFATPPPPPSSPPLPATSPGPLASPRLTQPPRPTSPPVSRNPFIANPPPAFTPASRNPFIPNPPPASLPPPHSSSGGPALSVPYPLALAAMNTGASSNIVDEPPPAYTPI